uniref:Uncharacterized protein n=1 Tax=Panagrolaimus superbus TaxID=310955 RepID=A0A914YF22_9BILA
MTQYQTISGKLEDFVTPNTTVSELKSEIIKVGMETLNSHQKITLATFAGKFVSKYGNYEDALGVLGTVLSSNLQPFSDQMSEMWLKYEAEGKTKERIFQRGYKMADFFVTKKRVGTIYCRLKIAFNNYNATVWPYLKQNMNNIILFNVLDGLGTSCAN